MPIATLVKLVASILLFCLTVFFAVSAFFGSAEIWQKSGSTGHWNLSKLDVIQRLRNGEFDTLTKKYTALDQKVADGDAPVDDLVNAFYSFELPDPSLHKTFSSWVTKRPNSFVPYLARAHYLVRLAFQYRGGKFASEVHPEQTDLMIKYFGMAVPDLQKAIELNSNAVSAYQRMMAIQRFTGDHGGIWQTFVIGYFQVPDGVPLIRSMSDALQPKWGGDPFNRFMFQTFAKIAGVFDSGFREALDDEDYIAADTATINKQYKEALKLWNKLLTTQNSAEIRLRRAWVLQQLDHTSEALRDILVATRLAPNNSDVFDEAGHIFLAKSAPQKALSYFNKALKLSPYKPRSLLGRARTLVKLERFDDAKRDLNNLDVFAKWDKWYQKARARMLRRRIGTDEETKYAHVRALELDPKNTKLLGEYSQYLLTLQDCDYFNYARRILDICYANQNCTRSQIDTTKSMVTMYRFKTQCTNIPDFKKYDAFFPPLNNLEEVRVKGLKMGDHKKTLLEKFPGAKTTRTDIANNAGAGGYIIKWGSQQNLPLLIVHATLDHRIYHIGYVEKYTGKTNLKELVEKYTKQFGPTDRRRLTDVLKLEYRQRGERRSYQKILHIIFKPLKVSAPGEAPDFSSGIRVSIHFEDIKMSDWGNPQRMAAFHALTNDMKSRAAK